MMIPNGNLEEKNYVSAARNHGYQHTGSRARGKPTILRFIQIVGMKKMRLIRIMKAYKWQRRSSSRQRHKRASLLLC